MEPGRRQEGSKLRLRRPRRQGGDSSRGGGGGVCAGAPETPATPGGSAAWFRKQDLSSAERPWVTLLSSSEPPLDSSCLETVAGLPPFLPKSFRAANPRPTPEPFHVGAKTFAWVPFPPHGGGNAHGTGLGSCGTEIPRESDEGGRWSEGAPVVLEPTSLTSGQTPEGPRVWRSAKLSTTLEGEEGTGTWGPLDPVGPSWSTAAREREEKFEVHRPAGTQRKGEESLKGCAPAVPVLPARGLPSAGSTERAEARDSDEEEEEEEFPALDRCPMCPMLFPGTWSRLDVDRHLAKCLSESAEDLMAGDLSE